MIIPTRFGPVGPLWPAQAFDGQTFNFKIFRFKAFDVNAWQAWAFCRLVSADLISIDLRVTLVSVMTRSLVQAMDALVHHVMGRAWREGPLRRRYHGCCHHGGSSPALGSVNSFRRSGELS
ncbi:hypothetical protein AB8Z38_26815 [Bradyrhizobium sp. LLZ17]|uniref:Uncharacterized protein n=1 Tax=Bradyrhizobium sp. LLZ17 TaxID=3239388 RepID=A0AB39XHM3_9BRAD